MFTSTLTLALLPLLALASPQYGGYGGTGPAATSTAAAAAASSAPPNTAGQINVNVGASGLTFSPANFSAPVGTLVSFFFPSSIPHSVSQSSFANPCTPLSGSSGNGFDSGLTSGKEFTINITDASTPIWFFCKAPTHCGSGMVGSINAPATGNTFDAFQAAALKIGSSEPTIADNGPVTGGVGAIATSGPTASSAASSAPSPTKSSGGSSSGAGRIVATSGMGLVAVVLILALAA